MPQQRRKTKTKAEQKAAQRRFRAQDRRSPIQMSKNENMTVILSDIAEIETQIKTITQQFQSYALEVSDAIKLVLEEAGVWEQVHALETERQNTQKKAQEKVNLLSSQLQDLHKVREFLVSREKIAAPVKPAIAETPLVSAPKVAKHKSPKPPVF